MIRSCPLLIGAAVVCGVIFSACREEQKVDAPDKSPGTQPAVADTGGQTICPIGGEKIDLAVFTEHDGKRVYFCCEACIKDFQKEPAKYLTRLPQFGGKEEPGTGMGM